MKKKIRLLSLLLAVLLLPSCGSEEPQEGGGDPTGESVELPTAGASLRIKEGEASPYVIICDRRNEADVAVAELVNHLLKAYYGVELTVAHYNKQLPYEIVIGNVENRAESQALSARLSSEEDFGISVAGNSLLLCYRSSEAMNTLLIKLKALLEASDTAAGLLTVPVNGTYLLHEDPNGSALTGERAVLVENGKTEYTIVCHPDDALSVQVAESLQSAFYDELGVKPEITSGLAKNKKEIVVSSEVNRSWINGYTKVLNGEESDFLIATENGNVAILATDRPSYALAMLKFREEYLRGNGVLTPRNNYFHSIRLREFAYNEAEYCALYRAIFKTFETEYEQCVANLTPVADQLDQQLVLALIERMGDAVAFHPGSSTVLQGGFRVKLEPRDYSQAATVDSNGDLWIPHAFAAKHLGVAAKEAAAERFNLSAFCRETAGYSLFSTSEAEGLILLLPEGVAPFEPLGQRVGDYTNLQYLNRMLRFFKEGYEPSNETEQSRFVLAYQEYPEHVADCDTVNYYTNFSPSILVTERNGREVIYASHELAYLEGYDRIMKAETVVFVSEDGGKTWTETGRVKHMRDAELFTLNGNVYLMGQSLQSNNSPMLAMELEDGNWKFTGSLTRGQYIGSTAPTAILIANGRIYRAHDRCVISASVDSDLFLAESWTRSNSYLDVVDADWLNAATGKSFDALTLYEGNIVLGQDGKIYNLMRINEIAGYIAIFEVSEDGSTVSTVASCNSIVELPTTPSKFTVMFDEVSGYYLTLVSYNTGVRKADRTTLCLCVSKDLFEWQFVDYILVDREMMNPYCSSYAHAYQYVDFDLLGDDMLFFVREAAGRTNFGHDGNYATIYTISNFRQLIADRLER